MRRRRSWYRRHLRNQRILIVSAAAVLLAIWGWQAATHFLGGAAKPSQTWQEAAKARASRQELGFVSQQTTKHRHYATRIPGVYPYSVVPGGIKSPQTLRQAAANDKAVSRHFSHFDFNHAHFVRVEQPREVYVSYRIRDSIFWTQKRIRLHPGELLLTDGKITARAKCGNQVSDTAKPEISNEEPEEDVLDQPVALDPMGPALPVRAMLEATDLPSGQPGSPKLFANNLSFPYVGFNLPLPPRNCLAVPNDKDCIHHKKPVTPEPPTMILLASGLMAIGWRYRRSKVLLAVRG
ncbi:MAG: PEP-CTERM sorting domain-containing protein [Terriglobales bacterium]